MSRQTDNQPPLVERMGQALVRHRFIVIGVAVVLIAVIIAAAVIDSGRRSRLEDAAMAAEDLEQAYVDWTAKGTGDRSEEEEALFSLVDEVRADFNGTYAARKGLYLKGMVLIHNESWVEAAEAFENLVEESPESYLAAGALFNAASCWEEAGRNEEAIVAWERVANEYGDSSAQAAEALFNVGRVQEGQGNREKALAAYQLVTERFPASSWTNLSRDRIIFLNVN